MERQRRHPNSHFAGRGEVRRRAGSRWAVRIGSAWA